MNANRSYALGWFLVQSLIIYTCGIRLFMHIQTTSTTSVEATVVACFFACVPATAVFAELFHRLVDYPSQIFAHYVFDWIRK